MPPSQPPPEPVTNVYVCGPKPLRFGELTLTQGVEVPEAANWPRVESWVSNHRIKALAAGEKCVSFLEFTGSSYAEWKQSQQDDRERERQRLQDEAQPAEE
jgi:hypothetical protein